MWDGLFMLLALSAIMGTAYVSCSLQCFYSLTRNSSFLAGILPLSLSLSQRQLRIVSLFGTGVLVGTSLIVIIPEGIDTMYSAAMRTHAHEVPNPQPKIPSTKGQQRGVNTPVDFASTKESDSSEISYLRSGASGTRDATNIVVKRTPEVNLWKQVQRATDTEKEKEKQEDNRPQPQKGGDDDSTEGHKEGHTRVHGPEEEEEEDKTPQTHEEIEGPHAYIGVALILGFILMFLVDHLPEALAPSKPQYQSLHISLSNLHRGPHNSSAISLNAMNGGESAPLTPLPQARQEPRSSATTIGLVIHACADGIALGASSTAPSTSLSLVIFLAIMLHKAPAAFGLTTVLLKQGLSKRTARTHLAFFSLAAPAGAFVTWAIVHMLGRARLGGDDGLLWTTGWVLLFSGGTFL